VRTASTEPESGVPGAVPFTPAPRRRLAAAPDAGVRRLIWTALGTTLVAVAALAVWQLRGGTRATGALPIYGTVPAFALVERSGRSVTGDDLRGRPWIASFIFTRCAGMCPALTTTLAALMRRTQASAAERVRAVTFTVDPTYDDPAVLRRYADEHAADPVRWLFLTGEYDAVEHLVRDGFLLSIAELPPGERERSSEPITHSDRFVLVDPQLRIRGYYHGTDPESVARLEDDMKLLARTSDD
jgi:protein SCO1